MTTAEDDRRGSPDSDYYEADNGRIYAFRNGGVFELRDGEWFWYAHNSGRWSDLHQRAFRQFRMDPCTPPKGTPPLPAVAPEDLEYRPPPLESYPVPDVVANWVRAANGRRTALLVLWEDRYESMVGDGKFLFAEAIFFTEDAFHEFMVRQAEENTYFQNGMYAYHLRDVELAEADGVVRVRRITGSHWADRVPIPDLLKRLERALIESQ